MHRTRSVMAAIAAATARIAPAWPLDRLIAVNPFQGQADMPIDEARARLRWLCGTRLSMPRAWYRDEWLAGRLERIDLEAVTDRWIETGCMQPCLPAGHALSRPEAMLDALLAALEQAGTEPVPAGALQSAKLPLATTVAEPPHMPGLPVSWADLVVHQVSQHNAAYFDDNQSAWHPQAGRGLYASWRDAMAFDRATPGRPGRPAMRVHAGALPEDPLALIIEVADTLSIAGTDLEEWCEALLLDVGGWAAWCAYLRHQGRLDRKVLTSPDHGAALHELEPLAEPIAQLLAIRAGWEWLLLRDDPRLCDWLREARQAAGALRTSQDAAADGIDGLLQSAVEHAYRRTLCAALASADSAPSAHAAAEARTVEVQALFCIDVRSEPYRRALEATGPGLQTIGFAGFFGLPVEYVPLGTHAAFAQVPGLLAPSCRVTDTLARDSSPAGDAGIRAIACSDAPLGARRQHRLQVQRSWSTVRTAAASTFGFIESLGLAYAGKLLKDSLPSAAQAARAQDNGLRPEEASCLRLRLADEGEGGLEDGTDRGEVELAASVLGVLAACALKPPFAPLVLIAGHGSRTRNNPHAAGLECGACGGHDGEVNARLLAALLNDRRVRRALRARSVAIEDTTWFVAGLHDTVTDELALLDEATVPPTHAQDVARLKLRLCQAGDAARAQRAPSLSPALTDLAPGRLLRALRQRANDWAQTRPEWGLAGNAALIAAPRARTARLDLQGRVFLHDYHWADDPSLAVLELIMTAPMVVAHWINMQYFASTVDNARYGSGNKLLHNVVGGTLGVFEGNGGDLRIGLPWQSLHDGERLRHAPLRLQVFIEAPAAAIESVLSRQPAIRALVDNGWLHLLRLDAPGGAVFGYLGGRWSHAMRIPQS